jgi:hypothetical protein
VGVVSLYDHASFRRYHEHENYVEWTFSVFDLIDQNQQAKQPGATNAPTPGMFGYGGTGTMTGGGKCYGAGCNNQGNGSFRPQGGTGSGTN